MRNKDILEHLEYIFTALEVNKKQKQRVLDLYEKIVKEKFITLHDAKDIACGLAYVGLRSLNYPVAISDLSSIANIPVRRVSKVSRKIKQTINLNVRPASADEFLKKYEKLLKCNGKVKRKANHYLKLIREQGKYSLLYSKYTSLAILYLAMAEAGLVKTKSEFVDLLNSVNGFSAAEIPNLYYRLRKVCDCLELK